MNKIMSRNILPQDNSVAFGFYGDEILQFDYNEGSYQIVDSNFFIETIEEDYCINNLKEVNVTIFINSPSRIVERSYDLLNKKNTFNVSTFSEFELYDDYSASDRDERYIFDVTDYEICEYYFYRNKSKDKVIAFLNFS